MKKANRTEDDDFETIATSTRRRNYSQSSKAKKDGAKELQQQASGHFKSTEIAIVVDEGIRDSDFGKMLERVFIFEKLSDNHEKKYHGYFSSLVPGLCLWTHRKKVNGGHCTATAPYASVFAVFVIFLSAEHFLRLIVEDPLNFSALQREVGKFRRQIKALPNVGTIRSTYPSLSFVVTDLEKEILVQQRTSVSCTLKL